MIIFFSPAEGGVEKQKYRCFIAAVFGKNKFVRTVSPHRWRGKQKYRCFIATAFEKSKFVRTVSPRRFKGGEKRSFNYVVLIF
ncbi:MAG: hypothetical protein LBR79_02305 [Oscillospiraceae bacterium]|nr:hypothetical protein [Oscillospiraceae bacterium]